MLTTIFSSATNYYVSPTGSNSNNGLSPATAKDDIEYAGVLTAPGDTVFVMNGTYTWANPNSNVVNIYNSGTASNWIVFINYPGHQPVIKSKNWAGISLQGADYIEVNGFKIIGNADSVTLAYAQSQQTNLNNPITSGNGIGCDKEFNNPSNFCHHIIIRNCTISKCPGAGIYASKSDYIRIENNIVSECAWYAPYGNSGISLYQCWNSDSSTAIKNFIIGNTCYRNENYIPFYAFGSISDGNGIIIDDGRNTQNSSTLGVYLGKTYVANNLVYDNGGRGIHCFLADNVIIVNNTCYKNCQSPAIDDGELTAYVSDGISFINNISLPDVGIAPMDIYNASNIYVDHNLWASNSSLANPLGTNATTSSANFVLPSSNPLLADFHLQANSTAINAGTHSQAPSTDKDGNIRFTLDSIDIGCYEYQNTTSVENINENENSVSIFPNPNNGIFTIILNNTHKIEIETYNILGELIFKTTSADQQTTLNLSSSPKGIYFVRTIDSNKNITNNKIIIQ